LVVFVATFFWSVPAAGDNHLQTARPPQEWAEFATPAVLVEVAVLAELDALQAHPLVEQIRDWFGFDFADRDDALEELDLIDEENSMLLEILDRHQLASLSPPTRLTLSRLPDALIDRLDAGDTGFADPRPWLQAATDLIVRKGLEPVARDTSEHEVILEVLDVVDGDPGTTLERWIDLSTAAALPEFADAADSPRPAPAQVPTPAEGQDGPPQTDGANEATQADATDSDESPTAAPSSGASADIPTDAAGGVPPAAIIAGLVAGAAVMATLLLRAARRRRRPSTVAAPGVADVLEISRRMTAELHPAGVQRIAVEESVRLTGASEGAFVSTETGAPVYTVRTDDEAFEQRLVVDGQFTRVLSAGRSLVTVDQASGLAVAAVAVIADGGVTGAVLVSRSADEPFDQSHAETLELLAPVAGSALASAAAHTSAIIAADHDGLTNVHNRRRLEQDIAEGDLRSAVGFAMIDVDHFKNFNDTHGHAAGDEALRAVAATISENVRADDRVYRYGGEEFAVVLHDCTDDEAVAVMERVRVAVAEVAVPGSEGPASLTISVGLATAPHGALSALAESADAALYAAKDSGRNRVVVAPTP